MHKFSNLNDRRVYKPRRLNNANFYSGRTYDTATREFVMLGDLATSDYALGMGGVRQVAGAVARRAGSLATGAARGIRKSVGAAKGFASRGMKAVGRSKIGQAAAGVARSVGNSGVGRAVTGAARAVAGAAGSAASAVKNRVRKTVGMAARTGVGRAVGGAATGVARAVGGSRIGARVRKAFSTARKFNSGRQLLLLGDASGSYQADFAFGMGKKGGATSPKKPGLLRKVAIGAVKTGFRVARAVAGAPGRVARGAAGLAMGGVKKVAGAAAIKGARKMLRLSATPQPLLLAEFRKPRKDKGTKRGPSLMGRTLAGKLTRGAIAAGAIGGGAALALKARRKPGSGATPASAAPASKPMSKKEANRAKVKARLNDIQEEIKRSPDLWEQATTLRRRSAAPGIDGEGLRNWEQADQKAAVKAAVSRSKSRR